MWTEGFRKLDHGQLAQGPSCPHFLGGPLLCPGPICPEPARLSGAQFDFDPIISVLHTSKTAWLLLCNIRLPTVNQLKDAVNCIYVATITGQFDTAGDFTPRCQIVRFKIVRGVKLSEMSNCPGVKLSAVSNCLRFQIVLVSNCPMTCCNIQAMINSEQAEAIYVNTTVHLTPRHLWQWWGVNKNGCVNAVNREERGRGTDGPGGRIMLLLISLVVH